MNEDTSYTVLVKCGQCGNSALVHVPKGELKAKATEQACQKCGIKGRLRLVG